MKIHFGISETIATLALVSLIIFVLITFFRPNTKTTPQKILTIQGIVIDIEFISGTETSLHFEDETILPIIGRPIIKIGMPYKIWYSEIGITVFKGLGYYVTIKNQLVKYEMLGNQAGHFSILSLSYSFLLLCLNNDQY